MEALERGDRNPEVQCWRDPPCIRWSYATIERCRARKLDTEWPTWDPYLKDSDDLHSFQDLVETYFRGKTVFWTGDSVMNLVANAATCEAAKFYDEIEQPSPFTPRTGDSPLDVRLKEHFHKANAYGMEDAQSGGQLWIGGPPHSPVLLKKPETMFVSKGWHKWKETDMTAQMALADIIVVNYALHYFGQEQEFLDHMDKMFAQLSEWGKQPGKIAIFRDTAAEHYAPFGASDYLESETAHPKAAHGCQCSNFTGPDLAVNKAKRLNDLLLPIRERYPGVAFVPMYDITYQRFNMHEAQYCAFEGNKMNPGGFCCDCTHYCYTPLFWRTFFSRVYDALEAVHYKP